MATLEGHPAADAVGGGDVAPAEGRVESVASAIRQRRQERREAMKLPSRAERLDEQRELMTEAVADGVEAVRMAGEAPVALPDLPDQPGEDDALEALQEPVEAAPEPEAREVPLADVLPIDKPAEKPFAEWSLEEKGQWARENVERLAWAHEAVAPLTHDEFNRDLAAVMTIDPARAMEMSHARVEQTKAIVNEFHAVQQAREGLRRASWQGFLQAVANHAPDLAQTQTAVAEAALKPYARMFQGDQWEPMLRGFHGNRPGWDAMVARASDELRAVVVGMTPQAPVREPARVKAQPIRDAASADGSLPPSKLTSLSEAVKQRRNIRRAQNARANHEG